MAHLDAFIASGPPAHLFEEVKTLRDGYLVAERKKAPIVPIVLTSPDGKPCDAKLHAEARKGKIKLERMIYQALLFHYSSMGFDESHDDIQNCLANGGIINRDVLGVYIASGLSTDKLLVAQARLAKLDAA
jgi:hypothetical protein